VKGPRSSVATLCPNRVCFTSLTEWPTARVTSRLRELQRPAKEEDSGGGEAVEGLGGGVTIGEESEIGLLSAVTGVFAPVWLSTSISDSKTISPPLSPPP
jgi:hypothetical protein